MGSDKGGSADQSGMYAAMASAQAADKAYQLGEQQFQWSQQVWNQEQPLMDASEKQQMALAAEQQASLEQSTRESAQQYQEYEDTYAPLEKSYAAEAAGWDSPAAIAQARGQAMSDVAQQGQAGLNTAAETLRGYGINPGSGRYAGLYTGAQPMLGAAEAAAGTTAAQNLRLQKMGLEAGAIDTGRGLVNSTSTLANTGTGQANSASGSASGAGSTANQNLAGTAVGAGATSSLFNAGSNAMNSYVGAVNGYNDSNAKFSEASGSGLGSMLGVAGGLLTKALPAGFLAKGGPAIKFGLGGDVTQGVPQYSPDMVGGDERDWLNKASPPAPPPALAYSGDAKNITTHVHPLRSMPRRSVDLQGGGPTDFTQTPTQGGGMTGIPSAPMMPQYAGGGDASATPGGTVPTHASPSHGVATDDVPAMLTAHEFVIPKDVAVWKGHEYFAKQIDAARRGQQQFSNRDDIGGEPTAAIPQQPTFVSRPAHAMGGAIPALPY